MGQTDGFAASPLEVRQAAITRDRGGPVIRDAKTSDQGKLVIRDQKKR